MRIKLSESDSQSTFILSPDFICQPARHARAFLVSRGVSIEAPREDPDLFWVGVNLVTVR